MQLCIAMTYVSWKDRKMVERQAALDRFEDLSSHRRTAIESILRKKTKGAFPTDEWYLALLNLSRYCPLDGRHQPFVIIQAHHMKLSVNALSRLRL